jgi:ATP-dependent Lon protease
LRNHDYSDRYTKEFTLSTDISTRDRDGIHKTFSGLMKILFPQGDATVGEIEEILHFSIEGRKRVKDQLMRLDSTYARVHFSYSEPDGRGKTVKTLEEEEFPGYYYRSIAESEAELPAEETHPATVAAAAGIADPTPPELEERHLTFQENQKGITYDKLFGPYLSGATVITLTDPYLRVFYQLRNLMEFLETVVRHKSPGEEVAVNVVTIMDGYRAEQQRENLDKIKDSASTVGLRFNYEFDQTESIHARHIVTDHGWKISLDRGLDIFQHYEMNDAFTFSNRLQQYRQCKAFEITCLKLGSGE